MKEYEGHDPGSCEQGAFPSEALKYKPMKGYRLGQCPIGGDDVISQYEDEHAVYGKAKCQCWFKYLKKKKPPKKKPKPKKEKHKCPPKGKVTASGVMEKKHPNFDPKSKKDLGEFRTYGFLSGEGEEPPDVRGMVRAAENQVLGPCPTGTYQITAQYEDEHAVYGNCRCNKWFRFNKKNKPPKTKKKEEAVASKGKPVCSCHNEVLEVDYADLGKETGKGLCPVTGREFLWKRSPRKKQIIKGGIVEDSFTAK